MTETLYRVWCEWDIGQEYLVFKTEDAAWDWAIQALIDTGIDDEISDLLENGLVGLQDLEVRG